MLPAPRLIEVDGLQIAVRRYGSGTPLLALHGFPQTSACWAPLATRLDGIQIIAPDLPGFGGSDPTPRADVSTVSKLMVRLLDELGIDRTSVIGHDWGGAIAWGLGLRHADRIDRLIVANSPFRKLDLRHGWHMLFFNLPVIPEMLFMFAGGPIVEWLIERGSARRDAFDRDAMSEYRQAYRGLERQRSAFAYYRTTTRAIIRAKLPGPLRVKHANQPSSTIDVPTMLVWGMRDPVLPGHLAEGLERWIPDLRVERLEDVGHFVPEEAPDELAALVTPFLKG